MNRRIENRELQELFRRQVDVELEDRQSAIPFKGANKTSLFLLEKAASKASKLLESVARSWIGFN